MLKSKNISSVILSFSGSLLSLAALLVYVILPTSQLANGIEYSGTDAVWVLAIVPVASLVGAVLFVSSFIKNFNEWVSTMSRPLVTGMITLLGCMSAACFINYLSYFVTQVQLGFVAPYTGLVYEDFITVAVVVVIHQFLFSVLSTIAYIRSSK